MTRSQNAITTTANALLRPKGLKIASYKVLQNLWAGYGHICRIQAVAVEDNDSQKEQTLILKIVAPPTKISPQDGEQESLDEGHLRKLISYQVEQYFYEAFAPQLPPDVASVAKYIASINEKGSSGEQVIAMAMSDLRQEFPVAGEKRTELNETQVYAALKWLAKFHGYWWRNIGTIDRETLKLSPLEEARASRSRSTDGLWLNGGYTYLATRRKEYQSLQKDNISEWSKALCTPVLTTKSKKTTAELVAEVLSPSPKSSPSSSTHDYETLIHGDVKSENLFSSTSGSEVAFFDFQYVGLGLGVCDLAKPFTCSVPLSMIASDKEILPTSHLDMQSGERKLLEYYKQTLETVSGKKYPWEVLVMHWNTALVDWLRFQASWGFWGNTEWLEARGRHILIDPTWKQWIIDAADEKIQ